MQKPIKIIITEDRPNWRETLRSLLPQYGIEIIAEAENGIGLLKYLETLTPDVILLDLSMPMMDGNQTMYWINKKYPDSKVIIVSLYDDPALIYDFVLRDIKGSISKYDAGANLEGLGDAIKKVAAGGKYFTYNREAEIELLSIRQKEIVNLLAKGKTQKQIAADLGLTISAVDKQKNKIIEIFNANGYTDLLSKIFERGLQFFRAPLPISRSKKQDE